MKKILFISHDASLTGAPILLLNLIKLLKDERNYDIRIIIKDGRIPLRRLQLLSEFNKLGEVLIWKKNERKAFLERMINKMTPSFFTRKLKNEKIQKWINESDLVFSNTVTNGDFFKQFYFSNIRVISYIHELEIATTYYTNRENVEFVKKISSHFFVPSKAVASHLINNLKIDQSKISLLNYYMPFKDNIANSQKDTNNLFVIGIVGTLDWRKGADVLSTVVAYFFRKYPTANVRFVWKGADKNSIEFERLKFELGKTGFLDKVLFEEPTKEMWDFYKNIDVFLLLSKEDPYPLVVLEAARYCKPTICFDCAGGAPEFVEDDAGDIVLYLDIEKMINVIHDYYTDNSIVIKKGNAAYDKYNKLHNDKLLVLNQINEVLKN